MPPNERLTLVGALLDLFTAMADTDAAETPPALRGVNGGEFSTVGDVDLS